MAGYSPMAAVGVAAVAASAPFTWTGMAAAVLASGASVFATNVVIPWVSRRWNMHRNEEEVRKLFVNCGDTAEKERQALASQFPLLYRAYTVDSYAHPMVQFTRYGVQQQLHKKVPPARRDEVPVDTGVFLTLQKAACNWVVPFAVSWGVRVGVRAAIGAAVGFVMPVPGVVSVAVLAAMTASAVALSSRTHTELATEVASAGILSGAALGAQMTFPTTEEATRRMRELVSGSWADIAARIKEIMGSSVNTIVAVLKDMVATTGVQVVIGATIIGVLYYLGKNWTWDWNNPLFYPLKAAGRSARAVGGLAAETVWKLRWIILAILTGSVAVIHTVLNLPVVVGSALVFAAGWIGSEDFTSGLSYGESFHLGQLADTGVGMSLEEEVAMEAINRTASTTTTEPGKPRRAEYAYTKTAFDPLEFRTFRRLFDGTSPSASAVVSGLLAFFRRGPYALGAVVGWLKASAEYTFSQGISSSTDAGSYVVGRSMYGDLALTSKAVCNATQQLVKKILDVEFGNLYGNTNAARDYSTKLDLLNKIRTDTSDDNYRSVPDGSDIMQINFLSTIQSRLVFTLVQRVWSAPRHLDNVMLSRESAENLLDHATRWAELMHALILPMFQALSLTTQLYQWYAKRWMETNTLVKPDADNAAAIPRIYMMHTVCDIMKNMLYMWNSCFLTLRVSTSVKQVEDLISKFTRKKYYREMAAKDGWPKETTLRPANSGAPNTSRYALRKFSLIGEVMVPCADVLLSGVGLSKRQVPVTAQDLKGGAASALPRDVYYEVLANAAAIALLQSLVEDASFTLLHEAMCTTDTLQRKILAYRDEQTEYINSFTGGDEGGGVSPMVSGAKKAPARRAARGAQNVEPVENVQNVQNVFGDTYSPRNHIDNHTAGAISSCQDIMIHAGSALTLIWDGMGEQLPVSMATAEWMVTRREVGTYVLPEKGPSYAHTPDRIDTKVHDYDDLVAFLYAGKGTGENALTLEVFLDTVTQRIMAHGRLPSEVLTNPIARSLAPKTVNYIPPFIEVDRMCLRLSLQRNSHTLCALDTFTWQNGYRHAEIEMLTVTNEGRRPSSARDSGMKRLENPARAAYLSIVTAFASTQGEETLDQGMHQISYKMFGKPPSIADRMRKKSSLDSSAREKLSLDSVLVGFMQSLEYAFTFRINGIPDTITEQDNDAIGDSGERKGSFVSEAWATNVGESWWRGDDDLTTANAKDIEPPEFPRWYEVFGEGERVAL